MPPLPPILPRGRARPPELPRLGLEEAAASLARGGIVIFPTETLYAIGCRVDKALACARICAIKGRPEGSPLPLLAADREQAARTVWLEAAPEHLLEAFWPGPLSLLLPALPGVAPEARNGAGLAALRVTSHPLAARLAALAGFALTASSANFSGGAPAARAEDLDAGLLAALARSGGEVGLLTASAPEEEPHGGLPSTLAQPLAGPEGTTLRLLREGAVSAKALAAAGFRVLP
ncbi:MAG: Sua5/YciO/YrdC/YwlC family protein [Desulfovibrio sp.]|nr:Sua5/YciO/YrdC/YwlC family protein [Desulfovibrio sp.]